MLAQNIPYKDLNCILHLSSLLCTEAHQTKTNTSMSHENEKAGAIHFKHASLLASGTPLCHPPLGP